MYKKVLFVLCAMMVVGSAVQAEVYYRANTSNSWSDANNWYSDYACTTALGGIPTSGDIVKATTLAADLTGVITHDYRDTANPSSTSEMFIALTGGHYTSWTQQVCNITEDVACGEFQLGAYEELPPGVGGQNGLTRRQNIQVNITNNSTLAVAGDYVPGRRNYSAVEVNIEAGSKLTANHYNDPDGWRVVNNVAGEMIIANGVDCRNSCGWSFPEVYNYLGNIYYDFGTYDNLGATAHYIAGTTIYPYEDSIHMTNILAGGLLRVTGSLGSPNTQIAPNWMVTLADETSLFQLSGDQTAAVEGYKGLPIIFNGLNGSNSAWTYDFDGTYTNIYIPEPATMMLLGLGAVGLIRRKK